jgi:hypothetical protein
VVRQFGHDDRLLPLRVVAERNRGWGTVALIVNALSTFAMMLILTYQLQSVMRYSALRTGLALVPFALGAALGSAIVAPRLMRNIAPRWLINAALRGVLPTDAGAAGAATSAASQLGSSVGAALFNTIAATVTAGYLSAHASVGLVAATVHGFNVAMIWGTVTLLAAAALIASFVNATKPAPKVR